tara:strand:+ start:84 stop:377 length:294 start_codon:yes stop_codon:yes gene_type:complete
MLVGKALKAAKALSKRKAVEKVIRKKKQETRRLNQGRSNTFGKRPGRITPIDTASRRIAKGKNKRKGTLPRKLHNRTYDDDPDEWGLIRFWKNLPDD